MKKLMTLLLAAGMLVSTSTGASAVELKVSGDFDVVFERNSHVRDYINQNHYSNGSIGFPSVQAGKFNAKQRMRVALDFVVSEQLSGRLELQVGGANNKGVWGAGNHTTLSDLDKWGMSDQPNVAARFAYIDWMVPNTNASVRMGFAPGVLPSATLMNPVLAQDGIGQVAVNIPVNDWATVNIAWLRPAASNAVGNVNPEKGAGKNVDLFSVKVPMRFDGVNFIPWAVLGSIGGNVDLVSNVYGTGQGSFDFRPSPFAILGSIANGYGGHNPQNLNRGWAPRDGFAWWLGAALTVTKYDPFTFAVDAFYSSLNNKHAQNRRAGWFVGASAAYKTQYGVPTLKVWYASGDDKSVTNGSERPLTIGGAFNPGATTTFLGRYGVATSMALATPAGTWGISGQWNQASFMENLFHSLRVTYVQGTNSNRMLKNLAVGTGGLVKSFPTGYMSTADSLIEIDFDTTYNIYKNLAAMLEIGYVITDFSTRQRDSQRVGSVLRDPSYKYTNGWRVALNFKYTF